LNNPNLHRVFHGIDYTPLNALYPECLDNPPTQARVTKDIAILAQLTTRIRLYGTDCNQAELVLNAIQALKSDMKIWLGVWLDGNSTTNARSLTHMWSILDKYPKSLFDGVVIGNEVLFRQEMTTPQLSKVLGDVKTNFTAQGITLAVGTSDLGSKWDSTLIQSVDVLMANVHPFFGGVDAKDAASWTISYFNNENVPIAANAVPKRRSMISEVGWPTDGGKKQGSVAGVPELNLFMGEFVCQQNKAGLEYFWFSAFDEPWKRKYNTAEEQWEDKWGLLDEERKMKKGVVIPDCR
ncbi:glycoside hydrolase family 17 protein, partial [Peziza echinospora]